MRYQIRAKFIFFLGTFFRHGRLWLAKEGLKMTWNQPVKTKTAKEPKKKHKKLHQNSRIKYIARMTAATPTPKQLYHTTTKPAIQEHNLNTFREGWLQFNRQPYVLFPLQNRYWQTVTYYDTIKTKVSLHCFRVEVNSLHLLKSQVTSCNSLTKIIIVEFVCPTSSSLSSISLV